MKTVLHINQHIIKQNRKNKTRNPVITVKTYKSNNYANEVLLKDEHGEVVARVVYSPEQPLSCGATVWIETYNEVEIL